MEAYARLSMCQHLFSLLSIGADDADALGQGASVVRPDSGS